MTEPTSSKVPKIRFKGFQGEWEERRLGDLCGEFHSGKFIGASEIAETGKYPVYGGNGLRGFSANYNHDGLYALIGRQGALCGNMNLCSGKAFFTEHAVAVRANKNNDTFFLYYLFGRLNLGQYSSQSAQPGLAVNKLQELGSLVGTKPEQTKIGGYFQEVDRLIGLQQRKHDKLVTLKKAMLHAMFPQPGTTTPAIRFKGFEGDWAVKSLHMLADRYDNLRVPVSASSRIPGNTPYYGANGIQDYVQGHTHEGDFILVAEDGANDLKNYPVQYVSGKVWVNNHAHVLQGKDGVAETRFLKYAFSQINMEVFLEAV